PMAPCGCMLVPSDHVTSPNSTQFSYRTGGNGGFRPNFRGHGGRYPRRFSGPRQPRNPNPSGYYPCNVCSYGYQQSRPNKYTPSRNQHFRSRSYSGPPHRNASPVPSQAECTHLYSNYHKRSPDYDQTNDIV